MTGKVHKYLWADEQLKAFRDAMVEELEKRLEMMRKRQAYFSAVAEEYESFDEFIRTQKDWLEIFGIELSQDNESYLSLRTQLDYTNYETYNNVSSTKIIRRESADYHIIFQGLS